MTPRLLKFFDKIGTPLYYKNKETFGDIDIVVTTGSEFPYDMRNLITEEFNPNEIHHNGNVWSFDYKEFQVDLLTVDPEHFESNLVYLSYNDLGNFIGRLAHQFGLKYGQEGLWYPHYFKGAKIARIPVSKDYQKIYEFFGLDFNKWLEGFDNLEDIFEFIASSPYFDYGIFQMENLNHINRERNAKRTSYMSFLDWIDENAKDKKYDYKAKESYLPKIIESFPEGNINLKIRGVEYEHCRNLLIQAKFNGKEIIDRFGITGSELGQLIKEFKEFLGYHFGDIERWILDSDIEEIYDRVGLFLNSSEWGGTKPKI